MTAVAVKVFECDAIRKMCCRHWRLGRLVQTSEAVGLRQQQLLVVLDGHHQARDVAELAAVGDPRIGVSGARLERARPAFSHRGGSLCRRLMADRGDPFGTKMTPLSPHGGNVPGRDVWRWQAARGGDGRR
jgi:hypothetical protein